METRTPVGLHNRALLKARGGGGLAIEDAADLYYSYAGIGQVRF
ncbi:hypothetical protein [Marinobacter sp. PE14]